MILGSFYFRRTFNGNLIGEYMNHLSTRPVTESADLILGLNDGFIGNYRSTWNGSGQSINLSIVQKGGTMNIFYLEWSSNGQLDFVGEGFLNEDILTGVYCDSDLNTRIEGLLSTSL